MILNINTDALVAFTNKLEKAHKSALPVAVRGTLNDAVFDVKTNTMPGTSDNVFENRQKNFFKANSKFIKAEGFNINSMKSYVGFYENKLKNQSSNYAVKDLEQQEHGGTIDRKTFIPLDTARTGKSKNKLVKREYRLSNIDRIVKARNQKGISKKQKFIAAIYKAGQGGFVLGGPKMGENFLWRVNTLSSNLKTRELDVVPLYDYSKGRSVKVQRTEFMEKASGMSANKMDTFYINQATRQLKKLGLL